MYARLLVASKRFKAACILSHALTKIRLLQLLKSVERILIDWSNECLKELLLPWPNLLKNLLYVLINSLLRGINAKAHHRLLFHFWLFKEDGLLDLFFNRNFRFLRPL
jgi:hypothetical protein